MNTESHILTRPKIIAGIKMFFAFTLTGSLIILYRSSFTESLVHLRSFNLKFLALAVILVFFDWFISGMRIFIYAKQVFTGISFTSCVRASLANIFMGGVTPSQTAGGPGQIYILYKEGMGILDATVVSFLGFVNSVIVLSSTGIIINVLLGPEIENYALRVFSTTTIVLFGLILIALLVSLIKPAIFETCAKKILRSIPIIGGKLYRTKSLASFFDSFKNYRNTFILFLTKKIHVFAGGIILTALIYFNKFVIAYIVLKGLGVDAPFWQVVHLQLLLILIFYFSPTPGASGVAEIGSAIIMGQIVPQNIEGIFVLLWRFFTLYASMLAGAAVLMRYLLKAEESGESL